MQTEPQPSTIQQMRDPSWDDERTETWRQYLAASAQLVDRLDHELQHHHELTLVDYEILNELATAEDRRHRMSDLASQVFVSRSRLTYRIDRLVEVGFVTREECEDDRRGMWAIVTDSGMDAYQKARVSHEAAVDAWFFDQMSNDELQSCLAIMRRVAEKLSRERPAF